MLLSAHSSLLGVAGESAAAAEDELADDFFARKAANAARTWGDAPVVAWREAEAGVALVFVGVE